MANNAPPPSPPPPPAPPVTQLDELVPERVFFEGGMAEQMIEGLDLTLQEVGLTPERRKMQSGTRSLPLLVLN